MYDDFIERRPGAARDLEKLLNDSARNLEKLLNDSARSHPVQNHGHEAVNSPRTSSSLTASSSGHQQAPGQQLNLQTPPKAYDPRRQQLRQEATVLDCSTENRWLLVCAKASKSPIGLAQLNVCDTSSDKELFEKIRTSYLKLHSKWKHWVSLKRVQEIRFVQVKSQNAHGRLNELNEQQFELHKRDIVDIRKAPDMPPETRKDEYVYEAYDLLPPVGEHLMAHLFHHPEDANELAITCLRTPKKLKDRLTICPRQGTRLGWGIHLVERWVISRVWFLMLVLFMTGSLVFGICWAILRHDLQGAFGVSAYIISFLGLLVGTVQASMD